MQRINYGFDAPGVMRTLLGVGMTGLLIGAAAIALTSAWWRILGIALSIAALAPLLLGLCMVFYGLVGKHKMRDFMISRIAWRGDERVLDIGTG
jgi:hypothetical protein